MEYRRIGRKKTFPHIARPASGGGKWFKRGERGRTGSGQVRFFARQDLAVRIFFLSLIVRTNFVHKTKPYDNDKPSLRSVYVEVRFRPPCSPRHSLPKGRKRIGQAAPPGARTPKLPPQAVALLIRTRMPARAAHIPAETAPCAAIPVSFLTRF